MATSAEQLTGLYQQYFGRAPDEEGFNFWLNSGYTPEQIAAEFQKSPEYQGLQAKPYATGTAATSDQIGALYKDVLKRDVDPEGLAFYGSSGWSPEQIKQELLKSSEYQGLQTKPTDVKTDVKTGTDVSGGGTSVDYLGKDIDPSQSTLSPNFADYVYKMLAMGEEAASRPYEAFTGERFAGPSDLQTQAFQGLAGLKVPGQYGEASAELKKALQGVGSLAYDPTKFTSGEWGTEAAFKYMNPFLRAALEPQLQELSRRSQIEKLADAAKYTAAGAYGGSRGALAEAEANRNLLGKQADVLSTGYKSAYDTAMQAYQADAARALEAQKAGEASKQFGATYGLEGLKTGISGAKTLADIGTQEQAAGLANLQAQLVGGEKQQALAQQPLDFGYQQWQESMKYPYQQATYMQSLLQGLPLQAQPYSDGTSGLASALQGGLLGLSLANTLSK